jgi:hypothetical protein
MRSTMPVTLCLDVTFHESFIPDMYVCQAVTKVFQKYKTLADSIVRMPSLAALSNNRISPSKRPLPSAEETDDQTTPAPTPVADFIEQYKRSSGNNKCIVNSFQTMNITDATPRIIAFKKLSLLKNMQGVHELDMSNPATLLECNSLLRKWNLTPVSDFQLENDVHYGVYDDTGKLITYMAILTGVYDKSPRPRKIAVSVDWIVDSDPINSSHKASKMVEYLKNEVGKYDWSDIFTQCADKPLARKFWNGRLSRSQLKANILVGFFHLHSDEYLIYKDTFNMCT